MSGFNRSNRWTRSTSWIIVAAIGAVLLISRFYHPLDSPATTLCAFKTVVGLPCPACGLTRSFCAMAKGELTRAFHFNLLGPALFLSAVIFWIAALLSLFGAGGMFA